MFAHDNRMISLLYMLADGVLAVASFCIAYSVRWYLTSMGWLPRLFPVYFYLWIVPVVVVLWLGTGLASGIYREIREEEMRRAFVDPVRVGVISTTLLFALTFAVKGEYISRWLLGLCAVTCVVSMILFRLLARRLAGTLRGAFGGYRYFLLVGNTPQAVDIARAIEANEPRGMRLSGFALLPAVNSVSTPAAQADSSWQGGLRRRYPTYQLEQLSALLREHIIDEVIFAVSKAEFERLEDTFLECEEEGVRVRVLLSFFPHVFSKISLGRLRDMPLLTFSPTPENEYLLLLKRVMDLLGSMVMLALLSPLFLFLAILIKLTSEGSVFYRQTRCGLGGRKFTLYKFRSMRKDADRLRQELEALNEMDGPVFKISNDPRCTPVGRLMRRLSLDELPQLFNVFKGDMSFVGPRPPLPEEVKQYEPWQRRRLRMQPGLTCLWALEGRNNLSFQRWMELDLEYIDTWSPGLDWKIMLKTIPVVLLGRGAS
jgi:exopolysaccharide biosynthesis polyprenyl glycosylphosphotransferase